MSETKWNARRNEMLHAIQEEINRVREELELLTREYDMAAELSYEDVRAEYQLEEYKLTRGDK